MDLERAPVLPYAVKDHDPGIGRRLHARGAGHGGGSLLLGRDPPVGLLELLLLDASQEAEQLEATDSDTYSILVLQCGFVIYPASSWMDRRR
ncbi:hypothetical protein ACWD01_16610 [Streptomyces sp. NPDC002835]